MASLCPDLETFTCGTYHRRNDSPMLPLCLPGSMPRLRELTIIYRDNESGFELSECSLLLRAAPNLTALELRQGASQLPNDLKARETQASQHVGLYRKPRSRQHASPLPEF
ncbi:hypothetical protein B0T14DRAFT_526782 [Immersiella caudata]|uniref:Uncharacterized protein n=1 Tax=Immersiella caudata TaxID=314043 RepID=A0AA39WE52_9PEZI|nr:hypothetical protein B0T14DRAFT_526782 [Immersiella caudata]